jgi:hypothetical protein
LGGGGPPPPRLPLSSRGISTCRGRHLPLPWVRTGTLPTPLTTVHSTAIHRLDAFCFYSRIHSSPNSIAEMSRSTRTPNNLLVPCSTHSSVRHLPYTTLPLALLIAIRHSPSMSMNHRARGRDGFPFPVALDESPPGFSLRVFFAWVSGLLILRISLLALVPVWFLGWVGLNSGSTQHMAHLYSSTSISSHQAICVQHGNYNNKNKNPIYYSHHHRPPTASPYSGHVFLSYISYYWVMGRTRTLAGDNGWIIKLPSWLLSVNAIG